MSVIPKLRIATIKNLLSKEIVLNTANRALSSNFILDSGLPNVEIPKISISEYMYSKCGKFSNLIATECAITGRKFTYSDLMKKSKNLGKSLRKKLKLNAGDVVSVLLPNVPEFPIVIIGTLDAGLILTTLNPVYTAEEISRQLQDSSAKALITLNELWDVASTSIRLIHKQLPILVINTKQSQTLPTRAISFSEFTDNTVDFPDVQTDPDSIALLPYSSGTTGLPKGVQLSHYTIVANTYQMMVPELNVFQESNGNHQDVVPAVLPMFHIYGLSVISLIGLTNGCKSITLPKFTPDLYISILKDHKPHILFVVPPIVHFLSAHPAVKSDYFAQTRVLFSGAAPLGALDEQRFIEKHNKKIDIQQGYGLTETSPVVACTSVKLKNEVNCSGSIGRPIPNTLVKVVDSEGTALGPNKSGELLVKGPQLMRGYLNRPEETANAFSDGWFKTGDLMYYNEDKVLFVTDRLKELIKVKGFQVAPAELEEIIRNFPNVIDAAVIGIPSEISGEVPRAYVVPKSGTRIDVDKLQEYVADKVAPYKKLAGGVAIVQSIPKNLSGKILRRQLKSDYQKENL